MGTRATSLGDDLVMAINYVLQDQFLDKFFSTRFANDFYLTGGTALARFYFNHRESVDLDLFTNNQAIDFSQINFTVLKIFQDLGFTIKNQVTTDTFLEYIGQNPADETLKVDIVKDIPRHFGEISNRDKIRLDSLENIGSNKVLAIFGRIALKDFIDLFFILKQTDLKFDDLFSMAKQKDLGLSEFWLAEAVRNIEKLEVYPVMLKEIDKNELKQFFLKLSRDLLTKVKPTE